MARGVRPLDSDQLGKKGQDRFSELCVNAHLIPNPSSWDRKGWDFIVDWRHDSAATDYDARPTLPSCLVQVKTIWKGGRKVRLPLLATEHIAKDLKPAFICALEIGDDLELAALHVAHLEGELLGEALRGLRKARADAKPVARGQLDLALGRWFTSITPNGASLRAELERAIGPSLGDYAKAKQKQLLELGYETGAREVKFTIAATNEREIAEAMLGMRPIEVIGSSARERRFGIEMPDTSFPSGPGTMEISPKPAMSCTIGIHLPSGDRLRFPGDIYSLPTIMVQAGVRYLRIQARFFSMLIPTPETPPDVTLATTTADVAFENDALQSARIPAAKWRDFYRFIEAVSHGGAEIDIAIPGSKEPIFTGTLKLSQSANPNRQKTRKLLLDLSVLAAELFDRAGSPGTKIGIDEILAASLDLRFLDTLCKAPDDLSPLTLKTVAAGDVEEGHRVEILYVAWVRFKRFALAYAASTDVSAKPGSEHVDWTGGKLALRQLKRINATDRALDRFAREVSQVSGVKSFVVYEGERK